MERLWTRPTFEVHGLAGGYQGPGLKSIVPARGELKVSCRLVPGQDPDRIARLVLAFAKKHNPDVVARDDARRRGRLDLEDHRPPGRRGEGLRRVRVRARARVRARRRQHRHGPLDGEDPRLPGRLPGPLDARPRLPRAQRELRVGPGGLRAWPRSRASSRNGAVSDSSPCTYIHRGYSGAHDRARAVDLPARCRSRRSTSCWPWPRTTATATGSSRTWPPAPDGALKLSRGHALPLDPAHAGGRPDRGDRHAPRRRRTTTSGAATTASPRSAPRWRGPRRRGSADLVALRPRGGPRAGKA